MYKKNPKTTKKIDRWILWGFWGSDRYPELEWSVLFCSLAYLHNMRDLERSFTSTKMAWHGLAKYSLKMSYIWVEVQYTINQLSHDISPLWRRILWRVIWMRQLFQFRGKLPIWCFLSKIVASYLITILYSNQRNMPYDQDLRISRGANIQLESGWWAPWSVSSLMVYIHDTAIWAVSERSLVDGRSSKHLCALNLDCTISRQMEYQGQH